jgi:hypothetical protein
VWLWFGWALWGRSIHPGVVVGVHKEFLMKKLSGKSVLLFGVVLVVCAFAVPSMASAASFSGTAGTHPLFSPNLAFSAPTAAIGSSCADSRFDFDLNNGNDGIITGSRFQNCRGLPGTAASNCTVTATGTKFPWTATAAAGTDNLQIHGVHVDVGFEALPGTAAAECLANGVQITLTGTLTGGSWNPTSREITFESDDGLVGHPNTGAASAPAFVTGTIRDLNQTLNVIM